MLQPGNNLMDMLLGATDQPRNLVPFGGETPAVLGQPMFGDILGLLTGEQTTDIPLGSVQPAQPELSLPFPASQDLSTLVGMAQLEDLTSSPTPFTASQGDTLPHPPIPVAGDIPVGIAETLPQNPALFAIPNQILIPAQLGDMEIKEQRPLDLPWGTYEILQSEITDDRLELKIRSTSAGAQEIKLSIPVNLFSKPHFKGQPLQGQRIALEGMPDKQGWQDYLAKLNLKSIEISQVPAESDSQPDKPVQLRIVADNGPVEVLLRASIAKQDIRIVPTGKRPTLSSPANDSSLLAESDDEPALRESVQNGTKHNSLLSGRSQQPGMAATGSDDERLWHKEIDLVGKQPEPVKAAVAKNPDLQNHTAVQKNVPSPVRMSLPENSFQIARPNGQAIMIKIEPDHLGPARLNLVMRGDGLTARVIVQSSIAQAVVEGSLDQLTEQLSRAGIKVDHIQISVGGEQMRNQFFDRSAWYRPAGTRHHRKNIDSIPEYEDTSLMPPPKPSEYMDSQGVNLFA